ncbi:serine protease Hayan-like isoform X2 [Plodia interpunctella]|uniref:serine protease Hayan-like isoform X2 n=1 Tax=Plodia interpunctella TaxID=58824 RepID=UPI002367E0BB|nr:serine protease Hayan-like isoform X2 [Plodia interpunctella]
MSVKNKIYDKFERCGFLGDNEIVCCPRTTDKFGIGTSDTPSVSLRKADRECEKIIKSTITPLDLHIIGGDIATPGEFPHMVALGFDRGEGYIFDCGGALVSTTFVITAAHCVDTLDKIKPSIIRAGVVEIGSSEWNDKSDIRIEEIIIHPDYKRREKYHDVALLRLERPVKVSSDVNAVCLYTANEDPTVPLTITGWGRTSTSRNVRSNVLLKTNVTVVGRSKCSESYANWRKLPSGIASGQLCAGDPNGLHDSCQGDSGGPLQLPPARDAQYRLVGVTSFGRGCGSAQPGVYTRLHHYLDWIERQVWPN